MSTFPLKAQSSPYSSVDGAVRAVKLNGACDEAHTGLIRNDLKSLGTTSAELYHVYRTSVPHAAALRRHFSSIEPLSNRGRGRVRRESGLGVR